MANVVITSTANGLKFDTGIYASVVGFTKAYRKKDSFRRVTLHSDWVEYLADEGRVFSLHWQVNTVNAVIIDSIDGVAPTSLSDLYDKLINLLG